MHADNAAVSNLDAIAQRGVHADETEISNPHPTADDDVAGDKAMRADTGMVTKMICLILSKIGIIAKILQMCCL